ncbi:MAG: hypothetical protein PVF42_03995 [Desulfobacterales bacterium]
MSQPIGHDKVPMFFWGPLPDQGSLEKYGRLLRSEIIKVSPLRNYHLYFSYMTLILMGAW